MKVKGFLQGRGVERRVGLGERGGLNVKNERGLVGRELRAAMKVVVLVHGSLGPREA